MRVLVIHGPNLDMLGIREPGIYGTRTLADLNETLSEHAAKIGFALTFAQANSEGAMIDALHAARDGVDAVIINPGAFGHYAYAVRDAIAAGELPAIEVHLSNVYDRESFRSTSVIAAVCIGSIAGFGETSYALALEALRRRKDAENP